MEDDSKISHIYLEGKIGKVNENKLQEDLKSNLNKIQTTETVEDIAISRKSEKDKYAQKENTSQEDVYGRDSCVAEASKINPLPILTHENERTVICEFVTKDDVDAGSVFSLFMEKDFRYYFQHPYFRLFTAYFVTFCNFLIYAEDPVAHSKNECSIPVIGNCFSFVFKKYLPNAWSLLKVCSWMCGTLVGLFMGKVVFHTWLFNRIFRLKMFHDDKGSWMTMFFSTILFVFIFSYIYNAFLEIGGDYTAPYRISTYLGLSNSVFMKAAATGTWCGDFFTAWMVTDMMLQEKLYPSWAKPLRKWWNTGIRRIILFWVVTSGTSFIVIFVIATDYINWDSLSRHFLHTNEMSRAFLASFILVLDVTIVMQDWDFPHFVSGLDIKLPGVNTAHIRFKIPKLFTKLEHWHIHISGKWFNYGILFIVILLDLNMWKNQIFYAPFDYGQYVDEERCIYTVEDLYSLVYANSSALTYDYRNSTVNNITSRLFILEDIKMNSRYYGYPMELKGLAFVPSLVIFLIFGIMVFIYGRRPKPSGDHPYGDRLRKRRKRFNAREKWNSMKSWFLKDRSSHISRSMVLRGQPDCTSHEKEDQRELEVVGYRQTLEENDRESRKEGSELKEESVTFLEETLLEEK